jgi:hypothetical protein
MQGGVDRNGRNKEKPSLVNQQLLSSQQQQHTGEHVNTSSSSSNNNNNNSNNNNNTSKKQRELEWGVLPHGVTDSILGFVGSADMMGYICIVSKGFKSWASEYACQQICKRIFTAQTQRNKLKIENWRSWSNMLIHRPRLRVNGFYSLRTLFSKAPCNDRFWEVKNLQSIEVCQQFEDSACACIILIYSGMYVP